MEKTGFHHQPEQNELYYRIAGRIPLAGATALYYFDKKGKLQGMLKALKYKDAPQLGIRFGQLLGHELQNSSFIEPVEMIIPVPLHPRKKIARGYNQAAYFAKGLSKSLNIPIDSQSLTRKLATRSQTRKNADARWANVGKAFTCKSTVPQHILLVDDVITTGSTLVACVHAMMDSPAPPLSIRMAAIGMARQG